MPDQPEITEDPLVYAIVNERADHLLDYDHLAELLEVPEGGDVLVALCARLTQYRLPPFQQGVATAFVAKFARKVLLFNAYEGGHWEDPYA